MLLVPKATILYNIKKGSAVKDKKEIVCRKGHRYRTPFIISHTHPCRQCKQNTQRVWRISVKGYTGQYLYKLRRRIEYKRERIRQLEQEIARRNGGV